MECMKCGFKNESDAKFCRDCGTKMPALKSQVAFEPGKRRIKDQDVTGGMVIGVVFIVIAIIMAAAIFTNFFSDFGSGIGAFFGDFGENMGQMGSDFGNFMGNWGENLGESFGSFFSGQAWWDLIKVFLVGSFLLVGIILIVYNYNKTR